MATTVVSSEMQSPFTQEMKWRMPATWDITMTIAEFNGTTQGGMVIVPGVVGKSFVPTDVMFKVTGGAAVGGSLVLLQVVDEDGGVVLSHVKADCTDGTWVSKTGGTVVSTRMSFPTATGKGLKCQPTGADVGTATGARVLVKGFYITA
jgi:hypothetical protein